MSATVDYQADQSVALAMSCGLIEFERVRPFHLLKIAETNASVTNPVIELRYNCWITQGAYTMCLLQRFVLSGMIAGTLAVCSAAVFADGSSGLGVNRPQTPELSVVPGYHVYRVDRPGVTYIQVNSANGAVGTAIAATETATSGAASFIDAVAAGSGTGVNHAI